MHECSHARELPLQLCSPLLEKGQGQEKARKGGILSLGLTAPGLVPRAQHPVLSASCINETCTGMSSPETSTETAAVMTLRVTNTKSKVVIVHLEEGRQRCYLEV